MVLQYGVFIKGCLIHMESNQCLVLCPLYDLLLSQSHFGRTALEGGRVGRREWNAMLTIVASTAC